MGKFREFAAATAKIGGKFSTTVHRKGAKTARTEGSGRWKRHKIGEKGGKNPLPAEGVWGKLGAGAARWKSRFLFPGGAAVRPRDVGQF